MAKQVKKLLQSRTGVGGGGSLEMDNLGNAKKKGFFLGFRPLCQTLKICPIDKRLVTLEIWAYFYTRWLITAAGVWHRLWLWSLQPVQT